jgi:uncharacterized protein
MQVHSRRENSARPQQMDFTYAMSAADLGTLGLGLLIAGVVAGVVSGMLGVGGGIVIVPILYHVLGAAGVADDLRMHIAVGTSLAVIVPTSISSLSAHARKNAVDWDLLKRWAAPMLAGVVLGSALSGIARGRTLTLAFAVLALPVGAYLAFGKESWRLAQRIPRGAGGALVPFGIGGISTMMGIGGGMTGVPAQTLCGVPVHRAVGTASAFGTIISVPGAIGAAIAGWGLHGLPPYSYGYVNLVAFAIVAPAAFFVAPFGASIAHMADTTRLRRVFALFVAVTAAKMLWDVFG